MTLFPPRRALAPQLLHFALVAVAATLLSLGLWRAGWRWGALLDSAALDAYFALRGARPPAEVAEQWPASRSIITIELRHETPRPQLARLLDKLHRARAVGLDLMFFDRAAPLSPEEKPLYRGEIARWKREDALLCAAIARAGNVVLGAWPDGATTNRRNWELPAPTLARGATLAHFAVWPDANDGIVRGVRLWENVNGTPRPAFSLALASRMKGVAPQTLARGAALDAAGALLVNYPGPRQTWEYPTKHLVFESALDCQSEDFAGQLVMVGETGARSKDVFPTPWGDLPGLDVHASAVTTLLEGPRAPRWMGTGWLAALSLGAALLLMAPLARFPVWTCAPVALLEMGLLAVVAGWLFAARGQVVPLSVPIGAVLVAYNGVALLEYGRARRVLSRIVGAKTATQLLGVLSELRLGGRQTEATAFFCDLRGYTTLAQNASPEQLIQLLNLYTLTVVRQVRRFDGRPIDYFGDGAFVLFEGRDHARRAVEAALATQDALHSQGAELTAALPPELRGAASWSAGIALHSGPMLIGMVGAPEHLKPGAVGDAVNVASRLQGLSAALGYEILLSRATLDASARAWDAASCGHHHLKGRAQSVEVFGLNPLPATTT